LRARENGIDTRIQSALGGLHESTQQERRQAEEARRQAEANSREARSLLSSLQDQLAALRGPDTDLPIGLGLRPEDSLAFDNPTGSDLVWIEPLDAAPSAPKSSSAPAGFTLPTNPIERGQQQLRAVAKGERELHDAGETTRPVYTLPENAT